MPVLIQKAVSYSQNIWCHRKKQFLAISVGTGWEAEKWAYWAETCLLILQLYYPWPDNDVVEVEVTMLSLLHQIFPFSWSHVELLHHHYSHHHHTSHHHHHQWPAWELSWRHDWRGPPWSLWWGRPWGGGRGWPRRPSPLQQSGTSPHLSRDYHHHHHHHHPSSRSYMVLKFRFAEGKM